MGYHADRLWADYVTWTNSTCRECGLPATHRLIRDRGWLRSVEATRRPTHCDGCAYTCAVEDNIHNVDTDRLSTLEG